MSSASYRTTISELGGGRVALLLLLFALALYQFYSSGFGTFAAICMLPVFAIGIILSFRYRMFLFWALVIINYLVSMKSLPLPEGIPVSLYNEALEIMLIALVIIDVKDTKFNATHSVMLTALVIWCGFIILELINDTCGMAGDFATWFTGARLMAFQLLYAYIVFTIYINTPQRLMGYLVLWGSLAIFSVLWIWKQKTFGFTEAEKSFIYGPGARTHVLQAGTLIRYISIYTDAAAAGIGMASTAVAFIIFGLTAKIKKFKFLFLAIGTACVWGFFVTGTRTAVACFMAGFVAYTILSKSIKMATFIGVAGILFVCMLAFTKIGDGNQMIHRMRTVFDKNDQSQGAREANREVMKKYMTDAPFGIGIGMKPGSMASNHKYYIMNTIPPDSEYIYIWIHTGIVGITVFLFTTALMFFGASRIIMFKLTSSSLRGIGAGLACCFVGMQLGGYGNQVLMQFPNCVVCYGGLSIVFVLPYIEKGWLEYETHYLAIQTEKKRLKEEKKKARRV